MAKYVRLEKVGRVALVSLNRPEKRNALDEAMFDEIRENFLALRDKDDVWVVLLKGAEVEGGEIFSAGIDLYDVAKKVQGASITTIKKFTTKLQESFNAVESLEKPVIALVGGYCFGAGLELALACDLRIMAEDAQIGALETALGLVPDLGGTTRLVRALGTSRAKQMILTAEKLDASRALSFGLVNWVVEPENLVMKGMEVAEQLCLNAPLALGVAKRLVDQVCNLDLATALTVEKLAQMELLQSEDTLEAIMAKTERREPVFGGK